MRLAPLAALLLSFLPVAASAWDRQLDGRDNGWVVGTDAAGDVLIAGVAAPDGLVMKLSGVDGSTIWRRTIANAVFNGIAVDANGDAFLTGYVSNEDTDVIMAKVAGLDGAVVWRHDHDGSAPTEPGSYQTDLGVGVGLGPDGHPIFGANLYNWTAETNFFAVKYDNATGAELWRREIDGGSAGNDLLFAFTVAADGDALLGGALFRAGTIADIGVVRLAADDGDERWRYASDGGVGGFDNAYDVALDAAGNVVVAATAKHDGPAFGDVVVVKLHGATGGEAWQYVRPANGYSYATQIAADGAGDVVYSAHDGIDGFVVEKLSGDDGERIWGVARPGRFAWDLVLDQAGNAVMAGEVGNPYGFGVLKLAATDGAEIWSELTAAGGAVGVTIDAAGRVVATGGTGGSLGNASVGLVVKTAAEIPGGSLGVSDVAGAPAKRSLKLQSRVAGIAIPTADGAADPTVSGATLHVYNPATTELATATLPAEGWTAVTSPTRGLAYRYKGGKTDPCQKAEIVEGKVTVACKGAGLGFTLDEASQGTLAVRLTSGSPDAGVAYCATFGGTVTRDAGTAGTGKGAFKAKKAAANVGCPIP